MHKCIKILAKRKRGNKFPLRGTRKFGQDKSKRERINEETNPCGIGDALHAQIEKGNKGFLHEYVIFNIEEETTLLKVKPLL